jgi:hypothetical protein
MTLYVAIEQELNRTLTLPNIITIHIQCRMTMNNPLS